MGYPNNDGTKPVDPVGAAFWSQQHAKAAEFNKVADTFRDTLKGD